MPASFPSPLRGWRVALLLVALACAPPGRAKAECGDHVLILNDPAAKSGDQNSATNGTVQSHAPQKVPCSGPNCSRAPQRQTPSPAPAPTSSPQKEVAHALTAARPSDGSPGRVCDSTFPQPVRRATSIFHPPRIG